MKVLAINGSPRKGWNTDTLVREASKGAASKGAETEIIHLYDLHYSGCRSCFGCKLEPHLGNCILGDDLKPMLEKIYVADGIILGSPIYLGDITAQLRALLERLIFPYISYKLDPPHYHKRSIPVALIFTSNCPEEMYDKLGYTEVVKRYEKTFGFMGTVKSLSVGNTLQVNDYEKYNWTMFNAEEKKEYREKVFPQDLKRAFELGMWIIK